MSLTQVSKIFKKGIVFIGVFAVIYYFLILLFFPGVGAFIRGLTRVREEENPIYGKLPPLEFIEKTTLDSQPTFTLNTTTGKLPNDLPIIIEVYKFIPSPFSYQAGKNAKEEAALLGFTDEDLTSDLKGKEYVWRDIDTGSTLTIEIEKRDLTQFTNLAGKSTDFPKGTLNKINSREFAIETLTDLLRFEEDSLYPQGQQIIELGILSGNDIYPTTNTRDSQLALVDFFRNINEYKILGPDPKIGLLRVLTSYHANDPAPYNTPFLKLNYHKIETETEATYPLVSVSEAWAAIQQQKGILASVVPSNMNPFLGYTPTKIEQVLIDNVYIAYYETPEEQTYLQPIYVFEGKYTTRGTSGGSVTYYYPAVRGDYINQITQ